MFSLLERGVLLTEVFRTVAPPTVCGIIYHTTGPPGQISKLGHSTLHQDEIQCRQWLAALDNCLQLSETV